MRGKKAAFTLAEVLITLAIIGIVAALSMQIIKNIRYAQYTSSLRKAYSTISQATEFVAQDLGVDVKNWVYTNRGDKSNSATNQILDSYNKFLKYSVVCNNYIYSCPQELLKNLDIKYKTLKNTDFSGPSGYGTYWQNRVFVMNDGSLVGIIPREIFNAVFWTVHDLNAILLFSVDVNGYAKPNQIGRDMFYFKIDSNTRKLMPVQKDDCTKEGIGYGCSNRIINNGWKMDY